MNQSGKESIHKRMEYLKSLPLVNTGLSFVSWVKRDLLRLMIVFHAMIKVNHSSQGPLILTRYGHNF
jgi:hypothetical protein